MVGFIVSITIHDDDYKNCCDDIHPPKFFLDKKRAIDYVKKRLVSYMVYEYCLSDDEDYQEFLENDGYECKDYDENNETNDEYEYLMKKPLCVIDDICDNFMICNFIDQKYSYSITKITNNEDGDTVKTESNTESDTESENSDDTISTTHSALFNDNETSDYED